MAADDRIISRERALALTVGEVMMPAPKTLAVDALVGDVRAAFTRDTIRTVLLADGPRFAGVIERGDLPATVPSSDPAAGYARRAIPTVTPSAAMADAIALLRGRAEPRLVVLDADGVTLRGLVCAKPDDRGFCIR